MSRHWPRRGRSASSASVSRSLASPRCATARARAAPRCSSWPRQAQAGATVTTAWRGADYTLPVWLLLVQAINHATEHRAQVAAILTQQGIEPPSLDGWTYHEARSNGDWSQLWSW